MTEHTGQVQELNSPVHRINDAAGRLIAELERKYLWWAAVGAESHSEFRIIAQAMNFGTFDDIRLLEKTFGFHRLAEVMRHAEPGWFGDRSWEFWRGRLSRALKQAMPEEAPRRSFRAAVL
ncbi:MAG TPA: hypothetical protein VNO18_13275 [Xanthobacteraceae bacterium]|jgi:hypothetical protein|nr:hypothetical protein [Xanthobacteraceae bacterium]